MNSSVASDLRRFKHDWRITLLTVVLLPLFVCLGFWQLHRADVHKQMRIEADEKRQQAPVDIITITDWHSTDTIHYLPVTLKGEWLAPMFLLDNQTHEQKIGYDVISVMRLDNGKNVLINRGWIAATASRSQLPVIPAPAISGRESGEVYASPEIMLSGEIYAEAGWPRRIARLHVPDLAKELKFDVLPVIVRLGEGSPSALVTGWPVTNIEPEKNIAYAIQWFGMAIALVIFYLALVFRRESSSGESRDG
ncbi:MAG TPA: SURF1 family protein [Pseudomonadales bacterium]|nr:SURF1 family protein [Pseudomonadales bacterium]